MRTHIYLYFYIYMCISLSLFLFRVRGVGALCARKLTSVGAMAFSILSVCSFSSSLKRSKKRVYTSSEEMSKHAAVFAFSRFVSSFSFLLSSDRTHGEEGFVGPVRKESLTVECFVLSLSFFSSSIQGPNSDLPLFLWSCSLLGFFVLSFFFFVFLLCSSATGFLRSHEEKAEETSPAPLLAAVPRGLPFFFFSFSFSPSRSCPECCLSDLSLALSPCSVRFLLSLSLSALLFLGFLPSACGCGVLRVFRCLWCMYRVVIWGARNLSFKSIGKDYIDAMVRCTLDCTGYRGNQPASQQTDVHYFSKTGSAIFNWRMVFSRIAMPVSTCILQIAAYDFRNIGQPAFIGEVSPRRISPSSLFLSLSLFVFFLPSCSVLALVFLRLCLFYRCLSSVAGGARGEGLWYNSTVRQMPCREGR